jgi:phosphoribosyl-ATP pyrophosphohydrolase/phosphoribosyl-AMP cyclohydrolase
MTTMTAYASFDPARVDWAKNNGLIPAIVQDVRSLRVLMLGYVNEESLKVSMEHGLVTFFSRAKQRLWTKGETSGNGLRLRDIKLDCDQDTLLMFADHEGPTCHNGTQSCFGDDPTASLATIADLAATIHMRHLLPETGSYTTRLLEEGITRIAQKLGEEGVETALAAATKSPTLAAEAADLLYHLLVLLEATDTDWRDVVKVLHDRSSTKKDKHL